MKVLKTFKKKHTGIVCIANAHWKNHYYYGKKSLWNYVKKINKLYPKKIRLDEKEYKNNLRRFKFCDFWLVGNFGRSALLKLRKDIVEKEIELARKTGFIPIGICEAGDAIGKVKLNVYWTWINKAQAFPNLK